MYLWQKEHFLHEEIVRVLESRNSGDLEALTTLGVWFAYGRYGCLKSPEVATSILHEAMSKKHAQAFYVYADLVVHSCFKGSVDLTKSVAYLKKAAELGFDLAMAKLGEFYLEGKGLKKSYRDAEKWLIKARCKASIPGLLILEKHYRDLDYIDKADEILEIVTIYKSIEPIHYL